MRAGKLGTYLKGFSFVLASAASAVVGAAILFGWSSLKHEYRMWRVPDISEYAEKAKQNEGKRGSAERAIEGKQALEELRETTAGIQAALNPASTVSIGPGNSTTSSPSSHE